MESGWRVSGDTIDFRGVWSFTLAIEGWGEWLTVLACGAFYGGENPIPGGAIIGLAIRLSYESRLALYYLSAERERHQHRPVKIKHVGLIHAPRPLL